MIYVLKPDYPDSDHDTGAPTRVRLIGPFPDSDSAYKWVEYREPPNVNPNNPDDDPYWQIVDLDNPEVSVVSP